MFAVTVEIVFGGSEQIAVGRSRTLGKNDKVIYIYASEDLSDYSFVKSGQPWARALSRTSRCPFSADSFHVC